MWSLNFPREVGTPHRRMVYSREEFIRFINANMKSCNLYTTVYNHKELNEGRIKPIYESAHVDRVYFDCDLKLKDGVDENGNTKYRPVDGYGFMLKIHEWCASENIKHLCCMTGTAYNAFISTNDGFLINKRDTVYNAQDWLCKKLKIKTDPQVMGDLARITRIPNTHNFKDSARRFCIPLKEDQLYLGHDKIKELAKHQQFGVEPIGKDNWEIGEFDSELPSRQILPENITEKFGDIDADVKNAPVCIKNMLAKGDLGWKERGFLISWLRDSGFVYEEVISVLKKYLTADKFKHCVYDERQPQYLFKRALDLNFPRCDTLEKLGWCTKRCK